MKKIALLFMISCISQLYGMNNPKCDQVNWGKLPEDVKPLIIMTLAENGDSPEAIVNNIKEARLINKTWHQLINKKYANQPGFTTLIHMLADTFNSTSYSIAEKLSTLFSKKYLNLTNELMMAVYNGNNDKIIYCINQGADVNSTIDYKSGLSQRELSENLFENIIIQFDTPLLCAFSGGNTEIIKLLLDSKANPNYKYNISGLTLLDCANKLLSYWNKEENIEIVNSINQLIQILKEAMKK